MCYITIFGSTHFGKSTLMGYFYTHGLDDAQFNRELKEIRKKIQAIGEPYYQDMSLAYFFDTGRDERHKYRNRETSLGTTKRISIIDGINTDITYIDTPGIDMEWKNRYNGQFMGDYGLYLIEAKKAEELRDLKRSRGDYKELQRRIFSPLFLWDAYKEIKNVIVVISKFDIVSFDMNLFHWIKDEINSFFTDINIIPISINVYSRNGYNIYREDNKIKGYTGTTLIDTLEKVIPKEQSENIEVPMFAFFDTFFEKRDAIRVKVLGGRIKRNDSVVLGPLKKNGEEKNNNSFLEGKVEKIRKGGIDVEVLEAGDIGTIKTKTICGQLCKKVNRKKIYVSKRTTILYGKNTEIQKGNLVQFAIVLDKLSADNKNSLLESKINDQVEIIWLGKNIYTSIVGIQKTDSEIFLTIFNRESEPSMFAMAITEKGNFLYNTFVMKLKNKHFVCCRLNNIEELKNMSTLHLKFQKPIGYNLSEAIKIYFENCEVNLFENNKYEVIMSAQQIDMLTNIRKFVKKYAITNYEVKYKKTIS